ncbi:hypothetical protein V6Z11_A13G024800 [Gossypium hirsutum]|uniref:Uncharacterized protein n=1 Tax=Gossypium darwinii TaxID=34276 RepID=A0A5D2DVN1_GOSDA|nr:hypothetical protein ES288_A13G023400v1 [Gossypium darwinii]
MVPISTIIIFFLDAFSSLLSPATSLSVSSSSPNSPAMLLMLGFDSFNPHFSTFQLLQIGYAIS